MVSQGKSYCDCYDRLQILKNNVTPNPKHPSPSHKCSTKSFAADLLMEYTKYNACWPWRSRVAAVPAKLSGSTDRATEGSVGNGAGELDMWVSRKSGHFYAVVMIGGLDTDICCSGCKCSLKPAADTDRWLMVFELTLCCIGAMRCSQLTLTSSVMGDQSTASDAKIASILHSKCWPLLPTNQHHERML